MSSLWRQCFHIIHTQNQSTAFLTETEGCLVPTHKSFQSQNKNLFSLHSWCDFKPLMSRRDHESWCTDASEKSPESHARLESKKKNTDLLKNLVSIFFLRNSYFYSARMHGMNQNRQWRLLHCYKILPFKTKAVLLNFLIHQKNQKYILYYGFRKNSKYYSHFWRIMWHWSNDA